MFVESFTFSVLRDPLEAIPSFYWHLRWAGSVSEATSIEEFVEKPLFWNYQVQVLTYDLRWLPEEVGVLPNLGFGEEQGWRVVEDVEQLHTLAFQRAAQIDHVGDTARLTTTLDVLAQVLPNVRFRKPLARENVGPDRDQIPQAVKRKILGHNAVDVDLYRSFRSPRSHSSGG